MIMFRYGGFIMRERRGGGEEWKGREGKGRMYRFMGII